MIIVFDIALTFSNQNAAAVTPFMFDWEYAPRVPKLSDLRAQMDLDVAQYGDTWTFKNAAGVPLNESSESSYRLTRYFNEEQLGIFNQFLSMEDQPAEVDAPKISIEIYAPDGAVMPSVSAQAASCANTRVVLALGESTSTVLFKGRSPKHLMLADVRSQLVETKDHALPKSIKFLSAERKVISADDENGVGISSLDPAPTVDSDWGVYTVHIWNKEAVPGTKWDGKIPKPPELISLPELAKPKPIDDSVPTLPEFPPFDANKKYQSWVELSKEEKLKVAKNHALAYRGFNLPDIPMGSFEAGAENREAATPDFLMGKSLLVPTPEVEVDGFMRFKQSFHTDAGYSRREVDIKRSLQVTSSVGVSYQDVGGAEAEFSYARNFNSNNVEEKYFFYCDVLIEKAQINLPFVDSALDPVKVKVLPEFIRAFDRVADTAALFSFMREYGSLIARTVTIGGLVQVTEEKTITRDFVAEDEKIAWKIKASGSKGPLTVNVSNQGQVDDALMEQSDNQFARTHIETLGGVSAFSLAKNMPGWVGSLSDIGHWAPIRREDIIPVYLLLDMARQTRFVNLLNLGGKRFWEQSARLPQLRLIDFDWYLSFYESGVYADLD